MSVSPVPLLPIRLEALHLLLHLMQYEAFEISYTIIFLHHSILPDRVNAHFLSAWPSLIYSRFRCPPLRLSVLFIIPTRTLRSLLLRIAVLLTAYEWIAALFLF